MTVIGWLITEKTISTKKGEPMEFVTLEDQTSLYDATLFPNTYRRYCHLLATNQAYVGDGTSRRTVFNRRPDGQGATTPGLS